MQRSPQDYKETPCPGCGRIKVRPRKRLCSGCEDRLRKGGTQADLRKGYREGFNKTVPPQNNPPKPKSDLAESLYGYFRRINGRRTSPEHIMDLSDKFDCSPSKIRSAVEELREQGFLMELNDGVVGLGNAMPEIHEEERIDISKFKGKQIRIGLTADNHLGSKYHRQDVLNALYDIWQAQGIDTVYQCGNMVDGEARFNKHDLCIPAGVENQVDYFIEHWPQRKGITTRFICGDDHEGWYTQNFGVDFGKLIMRAAAEKGRKDLEYLGYMEHDVLFNAPHGSCKMRIIHAGGGSAYALSYSVQKIVESYQGGEKPNILLVGHFHKAEYSYPREVHVVQAGCTEDQTPFMRKKRLQAMVGGWTISFTLDDNGIVHDFMPQFHAFYDRQFYRNWEYLWK